MVLYDLSADAVDTGIVTRILKMAYKFGWSWYDASMALRNLFATRPLLAILWRHLSSFCVDCIYINELNRQPVVLVS